MPMLARSRMIARCECSEIRLIDVFASQGGVMESIAEPEKAAVHKTFRAPQFPLKKFSPPALPDTLVARPDVSDGLTAGPSRRLTVAVVTPGAAKTVRLAAWAASRP